MRWSVTMCDVICDVIHGIWARVVRGRSTRVLDVILPSSLLLAFLLFLNKWVILVAILGETWWVDLMCIILFDGWSSSSLFNWFMGAVVELHGGCKSACLCGCNLSVWTKFSNCLFIDGLLWDINSASFIDSLYLSDALAIIWVFSNNVSLDGV